VDDYLKELNTAQKEAVLFGEGPLLVLAGAGSGKTRVLTSRVASLIARDMAQSHEITALTFTNKAAREMRERAERLRSGSLRGTFLGTFHRWALDILRRWPAEAGLAPGFSILDSDDQRAIMRRLIKAEGLDPKEYAAPAILNRISRENNELHDADDLERRRDHRSVKIAELWRLYEKRKKEISAVDFDDMLFRCLQLLRSTKTVLTTVRRRARFLLVDEFQDTNRVQMELLHLILCSNGNITAVGDEDQSIYRWRGARMQNILDFEDHFPGATVIKLEENYRSTDEILAVSGALISHNSFRRGKKLYTTKTGGRAVRLHLAFDEQAEARWTVDEIEDLKSDGLGYGEMAVLLRTNAQTRPYEEELTRRKIPYRVVGGLRFWQRAEVKDALAYLRLCFRPDDVVSFERVVNVPARGIGAATLDVLNRHARQRGILLPEAARELPGDLMPRARIALGKFFEILEKARDQRDILDPADFVGFLLEASGLLGMYEGDEEEKTVRRENLRQLASAVAEAALQQSTLEEFLDSVALLEGGESEDRKDALRLMTLHSAKGLEFDAVFIGGLEEGLLPHANSVEQAEGLEEERRLAYVGMTRARRFLVLTLTKSRFLFGQRQGTIPSRFLRELPEEHLDSSLTTGAARASSDFGGGRKSSARPLQSGAPGIPREFPAEKSRRMPSRISSVVQDVDGVGWRPGDRVRHNKFGKGIVLACQGRGPRLKLVVFFDALGRKVLAPAVARLEKL